MHESGIVASLVARAEGVVRESGVPHAQRIGVRIGALSGVDPTVVLTHWGRFATALTAGAELEMLVDEDPVAPGALGVSLTYVEVDG
jgi:Zn finger protein HypA/HybF involved in hydrogenase expression